MSHFIIVGAGQAGLAAAAKLRSEGFCGDLTLIGAESHPPYQRPLLSKDFLLGSAPRDRLWLRSANFFADQKIVLRLGQRVQAIDPVAQRIFLGDESLVYDELVLATGVRPRSLPAELGGALQGVISLNTLADVDAARDEFQPGRRALIVGGGYIGLEAAAVCAKLGVQATVLEGAPRILRRVVGEDTADYFRALHRCHGVALIEGVGLTRLEGEPRVNLARLSNGVSLPVDFVIVGIGGEPAVGLAEQAGCRIENGVAVDAFGRTSQPRIWAAGDCASFPFAGRRIRLESVGNAIEQAENVAVNLLGAGESYRAKPWFWSNQYDCRMQIAGLSAGYDRVLHRESESGRLSVWYYAGETLIAVDAMNEPRAYLVAKRLLEEGRSPTLDQVEAAADLRSLL